MNRVVAAGLTRRACVAGAPGMEQLRHRSRRAQVAPAVDHSQHEAALPLGLSQNREGSGTAWVPDETPMHAVHRRRGPWDLMAHGNLFAQYLVDGGERGVGQAGSINWIMGMAGRSLAGGRLGLRGMVSLEPWTIRGCGYPDLLASGESCDGRPIVDRQHPHDLIMELAVQYERPIGARWPCRSTAAQPASRRSAPSRSRIGCRPCRIRSRRFRITGSTPPTSPTA